MSKHRIDADDPFWVAPALDPDHVLCECPFGLIDPECPYCSDEDQAKLEALWAENDLRLHDCDEEFNPACGFCDLEDDVTTEGPRPPLWLRAWAWTRAWWRENWGSAIFGLILGSIINCVRGDWTWPFTAAESGVLVLCLAGLYIVWLGCRR